MANQGSGYGGGGAGGGEYADASFTSPSAGKGGYAACIEVRGIHPTENDNIKVNNGNNDYAIFNFEPEYAVCDGSSNNGYTTNSISKLTLTVPKINTTRSYKFNGLSVKNDSSLSYAEISSSASLKSGFRVVPSKIKPSDGDNLQLLIKDAIYDYGDDFWNNTLPGQVIISSQDTAGKYLSGRLDPGCICYFIIQGAGGGGGGADNNWGLFNYASGGGGGGGGGACVVKYHNTTDYYRSWQIYVGSGGKAGSNNANESSRTSGSSGENTVLTFYSSSDQSGSVLGTVTAKGGGGGGRATGTNNPSDPGPGGSRGQVTSTGSGYSILRIVDGGGGGSVSNGGTCATSGSSSDIGEFSICDSSLTINTSNGSGGNTGSLDDRGGGGGAAYLGNGGYY